MPEPSAATFVLVHGAWHGPGSWAPLREQLAARGFASVAPSLPADEPGRGADDYAAAVLETIDEETEGPVAVVGHSLGGLTAPVVAEQLVERHGAERVALLALVGALLPVPGRSYDEQVRADPSIMVAGFGAGQVRGPGGTTSWPADAAAEGLYAGVAEELRGRGVPDPGAVVTAAVAALRPQAWTVGKEVTPLHAWPAVPTLSVVCREDRVVSPEWARGASAAVGAKVVELPGGHFPMLVRPDELADVLVRALPG